MSSPFTAARSTEGTLLGFLVIGYEINDRLAAEVSKVAGSQVAFSCGNEVVATTLDRRRRCRGGEHSESDRGLVPRTIRAISRSATSASSRLLSCCRARERRRCGLSVLGSYDQATKFVDQLNRYLLLLGLAAILVGSGLVFFISHTFTRPLGSLVAGVRALEGGDFHHPLDSRGGDEVAELTRAFDRMRTSLLKSQRDLLESEQLATIGRMASSISHDLRHSLAAIVANSEFLCDSHLTAGAARGVVSGSPHRREPDDGPHRFPAGIRPHPRVADPRLRQRLRDHPARRSGGSAASRGITPAPSMCCASGQVSGWFDQRKLERALYNLLLNACEAAPAVGGQVEVTAAEVAGSITISVADNGPGIAESIRDRLFHPFVSYGKENGTGLGLAVVQKIVQDHGGEISVERTAQGRTVFRIVLPGRLQDASAAPSEPAWSCLLWYPHSGH